MQGVGALLFGIEARRFVLGLLELYSGVIGVILGLYWGYTRVLSLVFGFKRFFPTLAVGLLDFKVDVVLARLEADFSDQPPSIRAVPNRRVSLQCRTAEYPCSAPPPSIPAVPNRRVSLQCPTAEYQYSCSAFAVLQGALANFNGKICTTPPPSQKTREHIGALQRDV